MAKITILLKGGPRDGFETDVKWPSQIEDTTFTIPFKKEGTNMLMGVAIYERDANDKRSRLMGARGAVTYVYTHRENNEIGFKKPGVGVRG